MDLRPLSYEELCQMELIHAGTSIGNGSGVVGGGGGVGTITSAHNLNTAPGVAVSTGGQQQQLQLQHSTATTMLPIMVIPTAMMPPGTILTATTPSNMDLTGGNNNNNSNNNNNNNGSSISNCEHHHQFYQLQPTHIFATATTPVASISQISIPTSVAAAATQTTIQDGGGGDGGGGGGGVGSCDDGGGIISFNDGAFDIIGGSLSTHAHTGAILLPTEQHPHQQILQPTQHTSGGGGGAPATVNILYTGTLTKPIPQLTQSALHQHAMAATLPRSFQPATAYLTTATPSGSVGGPACADESDFEGSECGASVSTTTCIPHFRFGGCGMMLQQQQQQQQQHHQHHQQRQQPAQEPQVIGCAPFTHMMGSFAAAAGGAMHSGRLMGTFASGMGAGLSGTLGRNRRSANNNNDGSTTTTTTQTPKRVSFKGDNLNMGLSTSSPSTSTPPPPPTAATTATAAAAAVGAGLGVFATSSPQPPEQLLLLDQNAFQHADALNNCSYMHFDNFMDYQTTGFGGLPDVTEHSNSIRRTLSRQNSISNSDSGGEIASIQKSAKVNFAGMGIGVVGAGGGGSGGVGVGGIGMGVGVGSDTKSPTIQSALHGSHTQSASAKRKSKKAQQSDAHAIDTTHRYKMRRGSCILTLMLVTALCLFAVAATLAFQHFLMAPSRNSHAQRLKIVKRILRDVPLVDGHNNFAWNVRKYAHSSLELVHMSHMDIDHKSIWTRPQWAQTDMERLKQGLVGVQVWSAYVPCEAQGLDAVQLALEQIDIIRRLTDMYGQQTQLVTTSKDITTARRHGLMASLIGIEGGHAIGSSLGVLRSFYSLGARYLSLTHKCDVSWAGSSASPLENGLTQFGKAIIREMNRLGMMIDLSYSSDVTARDVLQVTRAPVIFSHSAARQLCNSTRNIPDDVLRLVAENGGLIMISFDSDDVACGRQARLKDVIEHINYIRSIAGVQHIGLGAGYDGIELPPIGLEDVSKYPDLLATLLEDHNWSEDDIAMLAGKNFLRIMETVENVRDYWKRAAIQPIEQSEPQPKSQCTYMSS